MLEDRIPVQIFGQTYEILGNPSETLYYNSLARFVEEKMKDIMNFTNVVSTQKIAVLAALNIAEELFRERENKSMGGKVAERKVDDLIKLLDQAMRQDSGKTSPKAQAPQKSDGPEAAKKENFTEELTLI